MKRYRKEFKELWETVTINVDNRFNKILSKDGELASNDEGQSYLYRKAFEIKKHNKKHEPKQALMFKISVEFNVTDVSAQFRHGAELGRKLISGEIKYEDL